MVENKYYGSGGIASTVQITLIYKCGRGALTEKKGWSGNFSYTGNLLMA